MALAFALTSVKFIMYMWESDNTDLTANLVHGLSEVYVEPWVAYIYTAPLGYKPAGYKLVVILVTSQKFYFGVYSTYN